MNEFLDDPEIIGEFIAESRERLESLEPELLQLERTPADSELINAIFRTFHTIKGSSSFLGLTQITELSHKLENVLDKLRKKKIEVTAEIIDLLFKGMDIIKSLIENVANGEERTEKVTSTSLKEVEGFMERVDQSLRGSGGTQVKKETSADSAEKKEDADQNKQIFLAAAYQHLSTIRECLEGLEESPSSSNFIDALFRAVHSLRNSSDYIGFSQIRELTERQEGILQQIRDSKSSVSSDLLNLLKETYGFLVELVEVFKKGEEEAVDIQKILERAKKVSIEKEKTEVDRTTSSKELPKKRIMKKTIRIPEAKLDILMNLASELIINRNTFFSISEKMENQRGPSQVPRELKAATQTMRRITAELQTTVTELHMLPMRTLFRGFPRLVRALSREKGKEIRLEMSGEEAQLDKMMIEKMGDPLIHLIRNAVDHGIDIPEEREAKGKPKYGTIKLSAFQEGEAVIIQIRDDGRGIDSELLRQIAIKKGLLDEKKAKSLNEQQCLQLIFLPGLSTAPRVTDISGRGVGMDVVKNTVESLKGEIEIHTELNKGTKFTIRLPLALVITDVLLVEISGQVFALPLNSIRETATISLNEINRVLKKKVISLRGNIEGIADLGELLHLSSHTRTADRIPIVIIEERGKSIGLIVDALCQQEEIVIKPPEGVIADTSGLAGVTVLGDGQVILILDPAEIIQMAES